MLKFTRPRVEALSEISADVAQIFFATLFIEPIVHGSVDAVVTGLGLALALVAWAVSVVLRQ